MRQSVKPRRAYDSPRRREQARSTRQAIIEAARGLFIEHGYAATSIGSIAARASVAPETIYAAFGTKRSLLTEVVDVSIAGGDGLLPILEQPWVQAMRDEPDVRHRLRILAENGRSILERRAAVDDVVHSAAAADPEIAALWERGKAQRHAGQGALLRIVLGDTDPQQGMRFETAVDILYALGSPETYRLLVVDRGWSSTHYGAWYSDTLERLLLDPVGPESRDGGAA